MVLTATDFDAMQCATPNCTDDHDVLYLHGMCHQGSPTWAFYSNGILTIECATCNQKVASIQIER